MALGRGPQRFDWLIGDLLALHLRQQPLVLGARSLIDVLAHLFEDAAATAQAHGERGVELGEVGVDVLEGARRAHVAGPSVRVIAREKLSQADVFSSSARWPLGVSM